MQDATSKRRRWRMKEKASAAARPTGRLDLPLMMCLVSRERDGGHRQSRAVDECIE